MLHNYILSMASYCLSLVKVNEIEKQITNIVKAIENGFFQESVKARITDLEENIR